VSSLDGSDNLLILKAELVANKLELTLSQGDVNILGEKLHHFGHQVFKVVEPMEGESHNLQKPMLMSSHCLNLHMKVVQFPLIVEAHQGSKMPRRRNAPMPILILKLLWLLIARAGASFTLGREPWRLVSRPSSSSASASEVDNQSSFMWR
jgi:hypothetical protein